MAAAGVLLPYQHRTHARMAANPESAPYHAAAGMNPDRGALSHRTLAPGEAIAQIHTRATGMHAPLLAASLPSTALPRVRMSETELPVTKYLQAAAS